MCCMIGCECGDFYFRRGRKALGFRQDTSVFYREVYIYPFLIRTQKYDIPQYETSVSVKESLLFKDYSKWKRPRVKRCWFYGKSVGK